MADPTIQTFCCHNRIRSPPAIKLMAEFDTDGYIMVCLISSVFGIAGAIYQIWIRHEDGPSHHAVRRRRGGELTLSSQNLGRQIIVWLAVADLCASFGVFLRAALWKYINDVLPPDSDVDDTTNVIFCAVSSAWIQYFYMCTWLWTLCYAINVRRQLSGARYALRTYHYYVWSIAAVLTGIGLTVLYVPDADCHNVHDMATAYMRILPNYVMTYGPMIAVMIVNPVLYCQASREVDRQLVARFSQMSNTERDLMAKFKLKFSLINLVFYICWLPNLVNGIVLWTMWYSLPYTMVITVWYIMAIMNPLQAFLNTLVYQKWNCRWRLWRHGSTDTSADTRRRNRSSLVFTEGTPLLQPKAGSPFASSLQLHQPSVDLIPTPTRSINSCSLV